MDDGLSIEQAEATTQAVELEITAVVPPEFVGSVEQRPDGVLLSCDGGKGHQWTGQTQILLDGDPDVSDLVTLIGDSFAAKTEYEVDHTPMSDGAPSAHITGAHASGWLVSPWDDGSGIEVLSFSPCFLLPDDMSPGDTY